MNKLVLSNSEKNLLYILSILFLLFLYINFVRSDIADNIFELENEIGLHELKEEELNNLKVLIDSLETELEEKQTSESELHLYHESFGNTSELLQDIENSGFKLRNYSVSSPYTIEIEGENVTGIDTTLVIEAHQPQIDEIISMLDSDVYDIKESLTIDRTDKDNFLLTARIKEITYLQVPITGIIHNGEEDFEVTGSLIDELYDKKSTEIESVDETVIKESSKVSLNKSDDNKSVESEKEILSNDDIRTTQILNYNTYFGAIDKNNEKVITEGTLNKYSDAYNVEMILTSDYFQDNKEILKNNDEFSGVFHLDNYSGETIVEIDGDLDFGDSTLKIDKPNDIYVLEYKLPTNSKIEIEMSSASGKYINIEAHANINSWSEFTFELPTDSDLYPLEINGIYIEGEDYENIKGSIKNFATLNKK